MFSRQPFSKMDFVAIDFETVDATSGGSGEPWQLGLVDVRDGRIAETREFFFDVEGAPERAHAPDALGTFGSSFEIWAPHLAGRRLVAHNIATERTLLTRAAPLTDWGPWTDTLRLARARYPGLPSYALGDLCEAFGLAPHLAGRTWHDGLYDAIACAALAAWLDGGVRLVPLTEGTP